MVSACYKVLRFVVLTIKLLSTHDASVRHNTIWLSGEPVPGYLCTTLAFKVTERLQNSKDLSSTETQTLTTVAK